MSIEETYKGMWSSDPDLLKSLLDAGETIIAVSGMGYGRAFFYDCDYVFQVGDDLHYIEKRMGELLFLIPPRPLVLEPKPLKWDLSLATDGIFLYEACIDGYWQVGFRGEIIENGDASSMSDEQEFLLLARAQVHAWRVNHLKSMLP